MISIVFALFDKQNPYYKLHIFSEHPFGELPMSEGRRPDGQCFSDFDMIMLCHRPLRNRNFRASLTHEWTHELMNIIFKNVHLPYAADDEDAKKEWDEVMKKVWKQFDNAPQIYKSNFAFDPYLNPYQEALSLYRALKESYQVSAYDREAIVRLPEIIVLGAYKDPKVQEFLKHIYDYWIKYIQPAIEKYINEHLKIDTFVSDWERENILDPFYREEFDKPEYENDLEIIKKEPNKAESLANKWYEQGRKIEL